MTHIRDPTLSDNEYTNNGSQLKNPVIAGAIFTLILMAVFDLAQLKPDTNDY